MEDLRKSYDVKENRPTSETEKTLFSIRNITRRLVLPILGILVIFKTDMIFGFIFSKISQIYGIFIKNNTIPPEFLTGALLLLMLGMTVRFLYLLPMLIKRK